MTLLPCSPCCPCPSLRITGPIPVWPGFGEQVLISSIDVDISFNEMEDSFYSETRRVQFYEGGPVLVTVTRAALIRRPRSGVYSLTNGNPNNLRDYGYVGERISLSASVPTREEIQAASNCGPGFAWPLFRISVAFNEIRLLARRCDASFTAGTPDCPLCNANAPFPSEITQSEITPPAGSPFFFASAGRTLRCGGFSFSQECRSRNSYDCDTAGSHILASTPQGAVSAVSGNLIGLSANPGGTAQWQGGAFPIVAECPGFSGVPITGPPCPFVISEITQGPPFSATTTATVNSVTVVYANGTTRSILS